MSTPPVSIAVIGAGLIGRRHIEHVLAQPCATLAAIVDPTQPAHDIATQHGVAWYPDLATLLTTSPPEAIVVATPNTMHAPQALQCVAAGIPALIEKPLADTLEAAQHLVAAAEAAGIPLLTGHHRRHNPVIQAAKAAIDAGRLGRLVAVHATCWFHKPASYFDASWRKQPGAGPVLLNLIHDLDLLRLFCGDVASVQALESNAVRGHDVEDTAAVLLRFHNGALGTITLSDTISSPWSWELTSGENPAYTHTPESALMIGGTRASLSVPALHLWQHDNKPDWWTELRRTTLEATPADPLALQIRNLCAVVRGTAAPVMTAREGMETLRVIEAIKQAAAESRTVHLHHPGKPEADV